MRTYRIKYQKFHAEQTRIYNALTPRSVLRCGRRWGKTTELEVIASHEAAHGKTVGWFSPTYKLQLPTYKRILRTLKPIVTHASKVDAMMETISGGSVEFWTLNDEDAGRSRAYDLVILDEASLVKRGLQTIWEQAIAPTLLDRRGRAVMAGTPKGIDQDNFFYEACTNKALGWTEFHAPTASNPMLDPIGVANLQKENAPLVYQQEFLAEFVDWSGVAFFSQDSLLVDGQPVGYPRNCDGVFAIIDTATKTGKANDGTAVSYYAVTAHSPMPLLILDWDIVQIEGALLETWLPTVFQNLEELARKTGARNGSLGALIEDASSGTILLQQAKRRGLPAKPIPGAMTSVGKDERAISVSGYVYQGKVKFTAHAFNKTVNFKGQVKNHMLSQVTGFRVGDKEAATRADDLLDTFTYGVALTLGDSRGY